MADTMQEVTHILIELCEWDAHMGHFESPVWKRARKLLKKLQDQKEKDHVEVE